MSSRRWREVRQMCEREGLTVEAMWIDGRGHIAVRLAEYPTRLSFSMTPSDRCGDKNKRSMLRRLAQGRAGKYG